MISLVLVLAACAVAEDWSLTEHFVSAQVERGIAPLSADVDMDGYVDIICGSWRSGFTQWFENPGRSGDTWQSHIVSATVEAPVGIVAVDIDGDNDLDLISASPTAGLLTWHENLGGSPPVFEDHYLSTGGTPNAVDAADLDGDGDLDVLAAGYSADQLFWYENSGALPTAFVEHLVPQLPDVSEEERIRSAKLADVNSDGRLDIIAVTHSCLNRTPPPPPQPCILWGGRALWYENQDGNPPTFEGKVIAEIEGTAPDIVFASDLHGDGDADIVMGGINGDTNVLYENLGGDPPAFTEHSLFTNGFSAYYPSGFASDIDSDGDQDIVSYIYPNAVWHENLGGEVLAFGTRTAPLDSCYLNGGDMDGDGDVDLVAAHKFRVSWYENHTIDLPSDLDGDGLPDDEEGWPPTETETHRLLPDSDGDGLADGVEVAGLTNPRNRDTDGDGLMDGVEEGITGTDPVDALDPASYTDLDGDGLPGGVSEVLSPAPPRRVNFRRSSQIPLDSGTQNLLRAVVSPARLRRVDLPPSAPPSASGGAGGGLDPDDANPDTDGDRFSDGYEAAVLGIAACTDEALFPPLADATRDGAVSNADALAVQSLFVGKIGPDAAVFQGTGFRYADPSRDGQISNMDALVIQAFFLGSLARLPLP